jgi:hypothetical protein
MDGKTRTKARIRWWEQEPRTFRKVALAPQAVLKQIPDVRMPPVPRVKAYPGRRCFSGTTA